MKPKRRRSAARPVLLAAWILALLKMQENRKLLLSRQERLSYEDPLTGGANEKKFVEEARRLLRPADRKKYALIAFHVRGFGVINEIFGYRNGTRVLQGIHWVFVKNLGKDELSAHVYADRFLLLLACRDRAGLTERLNRICADLKNTIEFYGIHYELSPAFGVCECPVGAAEDVQELISRAVMSLKADHFPDCPPCAFYEDRMRIGRMTLKNMADRLVPALENHEFVVYYQPKYSTAGETLFGAEALVRWRTDPNTLVPPGEFIPVFERSGKIAELDRYVFRQVCRDLRRWLDEGKEAVPVSVNLSRVSLLNPSVAGEYRGEAAKLDVPSGLLELEVTESAFAQDAAVLEKSMRRLSAAGFSLSVDDFGSEYSSLKMLYDVPAQTIKLDRDFLNGLGFGERGEAVVSSVIGLAEQLHMSVVAEGVETREQMEFLKKIRCMAVQGYYFSPPVSERQFAALLPVKGIKNGPFE
ncbi:GGDEF domain-containing protein [Caproiciproducens sp. NJN-50]|uniref:putative bifunctional diguanylate cyclase/phosphodiesterase n=1 Tax=Caproiciproducens sp. NJN-50 TaxID=2507162 RepID=UPI000FFE0894|nr:GGDEF domain-containing phosphodiesterase [Caproiciproducens sp. NJN-50]QAT49256.1 GGDEF domain-containing protein [Caproiciproducens sp. NJN-50]